MFMLSNLILVSSFGCSFICGMRTGSLRLGLLLGLTLVHLLIGFIQSPKNLLPRLLFLELHPPNLFSLASISDMSRTCSSPIAARVHHVCLPINLRPSRRHFSEIRIQIQKEVLLGRPFSVEQMLCRLALNGSRSARWADPCAPDAFPINISDRIVDPEFATPVASGWVT